MRRPHGMAERAFESYIRACAAAGINPEKTHQGGQRVLQTIGHAEASAGTHAQDGEDEFGFAYSAAVDISVRHDLTQEQIEKLLRCLWHEGFACWHRDAPEFPNNEHIHAIFCGLRMKHSLRNQVHSFLKHRSGLVSDKADEFVRDNLSDESEQRCRELFLAHNSATG